MLKTEATGRGLVKKTLCYQGYNKVEDVLLICCMAHCRRKFYEALPAERKKSIKLLDINSSEALKEPEIPEKDLINTFRQK